MKVSFLLIKLQNNVPLKRRYYRTKKLRKGEPVYSIYTIPNVFKKICCTRIAYEGGGEEDEPKNMKKWQ